MPRAGCRRSWQSGLVPRESRRPEPPKPPVPPAYGLQSPVSPGFRTAAAPRHHSRQDVPLPEAFLHPRASAPTPALAGNLISAQTPDPLIGSDHVGGSRRCWIFPSSYPLDAAGAVPGGSRVHARDPDAQDRRLGGVLGVLALQPQGQEQIMDWVRHPYRSGSFDFSLLIVLFFIPVCLLHSAFAWYRIDGLCSFHFVEFDDLEGSVSRDSSKKGLLNFTRAGRFFVFVGTPGII